MSLLQMFACEGCGASAEAGDGGGSPDVPLDWLAIEGPVTDDEVTATSPGCSVVGLGVVSRGGWWCRRVSRQSRLSGGRVRLGGDRWWVCRLGEVCGRR